MKRRGRAGDERGQILPIVIALLIVLSTLVPLMVMYTQAESRWTAKQSKNTRAFHLAESGIEKGYRQITISTQNWVNLQAGTDMTDFKFDKAFTDVAGGAYAVSITSGPGSQEATVISIGRDSTDQQVRALKAVYSNATIGNVAIMGGAGVNVSGNNLTVEWGAIASPGPITPNGAAHPSYWSANSIVGYDTNGATPPNCDQPNCWWWHSYYPNLPAMPSIDFNFYQASATASGASPCGGSYYTNGSRSGTCSDLSGKPYYVTGNWTSFGGPIVGSVIVLGNMTTPNGSMSGNSVTVNVPQQAWQQYCNDWSTYVTNYDPTCPYTTQCPGLSSTYLSPAVNHYTLSPVVNGLLYIGGNFTGPNGGGNTTLGYGVLVVNGTVNLNGNSHVKWYYSPAVSQNLQTTTISLSRQSWQDVIDSWPSGL